MHYLPTFVPGETYKNSRSIVEHFDFRQPADAQVFRITIMNSSGESGFSVQVREDMFEIALLIFYLFRVTCSFGDETRFKMNQNARDHVWLYFGNEICREAIENPDTQNFILRALLQRGTYVFIEFLDSRRSLIELLQDVAVFEIEGFESERKLTPNNWGWLFPRMEPGKA